MVPTEQVIDSSFLWTIYGILGLAVAIFVGVVAWYQIRAWCWDGDDPADEAGAFLTALRDSTREGDVTDEEYRSIQSRVMSQVDDSSNPTTHSGSDDSLEMSESPNNSATDDREAETHDRFSKD